MSTMFPSYPSVNETNLFHAGCGMQRGFSLVSAIFLLVVLSALGAFMLTFSTVQHTSSAQDMQGGRAYQAARAGIEWGLYQVLQMPPSPAAAPECPASPSSLALGGGLSSFAVTVTCTRSNPDFTEQDRTVRAYSIVSTATSGTAGSAHFVSRQLEVTVSR